MLRLVHHPFDTLRDHYQVFSSKTELGVIARASGVVPERWHWSMTRLIVGKPHGGSEDTKEAAMAAFAARWRQWLDECDLVER